MSLAPPCPVQCFADAMFKLISNNKYSLLCYNLLFDSILWHVFLNPFRLIRAGKGPYIIFVVINIVEMNVHLTSGTECFIIMYTSKF